MAATIYYVGSESETSHHAAPLQQHWNIQCIEPDRVVDVATEDDLAIFFSEHFQRFRIAVEELKRKRCRTLYAIDGVLEWRNAFENRDDEPACPWTMRPILSEKVAVISRYQARQLAFWGNSKKVELVGLPRLDDAVDAFHKRSGGECGKVASSEELGRKKKILVMTAKWPAFTDEQFENVRRGLLELQQVLDLHADRFDVVWRLTGGLEEILGVENSLTSTSGAEMHQQLAECDALITTPSTSVLEGFLAGIPTVVLEYNNCPQLIPSVWKIQYAAHIEKVLSEIESPAAEKMVQQEFWLQDQLEIQPTATDRLSNLIGGMLKYPAGEMPSGMVPIERVTQGSVWSEAFFAPPADGLNLPVNIELISHAAQLERDVKRLSARNEILEREFENAKRTIDNVISNPVISPLIKAANFAGSLMQKPK